jgi:hypothetical protein
VVVENLDRKNSANCYTALGPILLCHTDDTWSIDVIEKIMEITHQVRSSAEIGGGSESGRCACAEYLFSSLLAFNKIQLQWRKKRNFAGS